MELDTVGKKCALIGNKHCPGKGIHKGGCPFWIEGMPLQMQEDNQLPTDIWAKGCSILLLIPLLRGVSQTNVNAAASIQETRADIAEGFIRLLAGDPALIPVPSLPDEDVQQLIDHDFPEAPLLIEGQT